MKRLKSLMGKLTLVCLLEDIIHTIKTFSGFYNYVLVINKKEAMSFSRNIREQFT